MFDIGFSELLIVALVALIVIGPERLPAAARTLGHIMGRIKRSLGSIREDVEREIGMDELRLQMRNQDILDRERKLLEETSQSVKDAADFTNNLTQSTNDRLNQLLQPYSPDKIVKELDPSTRLSVATEPEPAQSQPTKPLAANDSNNQNEPSAPGNTPS